MLRNLLGPQKNKFAMKLGLGVLAMNLLKSVKISIGKNLANFFGAGAISKIASKPIINNVLG